MIAFGGVDNKLISDIADIEAKKPDSILQDVAKSAFQANIAVPKSHLT